MDHQTTIPLRAHDGGEFTGLLTLPVVTPAPGVLLLHEIFGITDYIAEVARRLALLGYVVLAPDLFWRIDPEHPITQDEAGLADAMSRVGRLDFEEAIRDCDAALAQLSARDEVDGNVGVLGFCMGGTLAFATAVHTEPDAVVSYYGSGVADALGGADDVHCPILFVFGGNDPFIPAESVDRVSAAFAGRDDVEIRLFDDAGHAFDNHAAPMFHDPVAAVTAWGATADFLRRTLHA